MSAKVKSIFRTTLLLCLLLVAGNLSAQTTAKGTVTDATGEPVIGATVVEKGNPKNAAVTDFDGNFTLKLQKGKTVTISYIGMVSQDVAASQNMKVQMKDDNAALEEVVVVGYTSKARKDLTGSVGSIQGKKLEIVPGSDLNWKARNLSRRFRATLWICLCFPRPLSILLWCSVRCITFIRRKKS